MPPKKKLNINSQPTPGADDLDADLDAYDDASNGPKRQMNKQDSPAKGRSDFQIWIDTKIQSQDSRAL